MRRFQIVGLTGPTGAGKSTVSKCFERFGFKVVNADEIARSVMEPGSVCVAQLALAFGRSILDPDGNLNRRRLAEKAFAAPNATQLLNDITHPQIFLRTLKVCHEYIDAGERRILFDAPVLFESSSDIMCDCVVSVVAPKEVRIERLMKRDGLPRESIEKRISAQHPDEFYTKRSDFVIDGGAALADVDSQAKKIIEALLQTEIERGKLI